MLEDIIQQAQEEYESDENKQGKHYRKNNTDNLRWH